MKLGHLPARHGLLLVVAPILFFGIALGGVGYALQASRADQAVAHHNAHLFSRSLDLANEQIDIILGSSVTSAPCSAPDLATLRQRLFQSKYVGDIARVVDGALRCSAVWGVWDKPYTLPAADRKVRNGISVWRNVEHPVHRSHTGGVAANDRVAVFSGPDAFGDVQDHSGNLWASAYARDGTHIRTFGGHPPKDAGGGIFGKFASALWIVRTKSLCAPFGGPDICVASTARFDARVPVALFALAGALLGAAIGVALFLWWRGSRGLRVQLAEALRREKIHISYQPLCALASKKLVGAEALARWTHDEVGPIPPDTFVAWVQAMGLRQAFTRYVVRKALDGVKDRLTGAEPFYLSVNVFPADLEDESFLDFLVGCVGERGVHPSRVVLEVTESAKFSSDSPAELFRRFRTAGFKVFLDDFGVGYSNLGNILQWDVDGIKLDRIFVQSIGDLECATPVLDQVIEMARQLDVQLVVEGVETQRQADYMIERAPHAVGQGWLFGRPAPASQFYPGAG